MVTVATARPAIGDDLWRAGAGQRRPGQMDEPKAVGWHRQHGNCRERAQPEYRLGRQFQWLGWDELLPNLAGWFGQQSHLELRLRLRLEPAQTVEGVDDRWLRGSGIQRRPRTSEAED